MKDYLIRAIDKKEILEVYSRQLQPIWWKRQKDP